MDSRPVTVPAPVREETPEESSNRPGDEPLGPCLIQPQGGEQSGRPAGQSAHDAGEKEHPDDHREKQHEGTDIHGWRTAPVMEW